MESANYGADVLTKQASCIHIRRQEVTIARESTFCSQARHVGGLHDVLQVFAQVAVYGV